MAPLIPCNLLKSFFSSFSAPLNSSVSFCDYIHHDLIEDIFKDENSLELKYMPTLLFMLSRNGLTLASGANSSPNQGKNFCKGHIILYSLAHDNIFLSMLVVKESLDGFNVS